MASTSVCVVLKVRSLDVEVVVDAVGGASVDVASEVNVGKLRGVGLAFHEAPMVFMVRADLVGSTSISSRVIGEKSASRTAWKEIHIRSR